jgi:hypothetical protein
MRRHMVVRFFARHLLDSLDNLDFPQESRTKRRGMHAGGYASGYINVDLRANSNADVENP